MTGPLTQQLAKHSLLILDGAMGTELQRRGVDTGLPLWSANALIAHPEAVLQIHKDYIEAGADIITTNTFRTTRRTLKRANLPDRSQQLVRLAVEQTVRARASFPDRSVLIAGSIAPLEDCYRPDLVPSETELEDEHGELASRLVGLGVDFIILETMNTIREAHAACRAAVSTCKEVVVSFVCTPEGQLLSGESLVDAVNAILPLQPTGFSINCVSPRHASSSIRHLQSMSLLPLAVYGNVGLPESDKHGWEFTHDISEDEYAVFAGQWKQSGARIIGGCCGTTPAYTRALQKQLNRIDQLIQDKHL
ncbi:MAG: homocysteine S-methyltransferase family protein [Bacteroidota bacterium]